MARRAKRPTQAVLDEIAEARRLLAVLESASAAYEAEAPVPLDSYSLPDDWWERTGRSVLLPAVREWLDVLESGVPPSRAVPWALHVLEGTDTRPLPGPLLREPGAPAPAPGEAWPSRTATVEDVLAWLRAGLEPEAADRRDISLGLKAERPEDDWDVIHPAASLLGSLSMAASAHALFVGGETASSSLALVQDAIDVDRLNRGAVEYNVGRSAVTSLPVPFLGSMEPVVAVPSRPLSANALRVCSVLMGAWVATSSPGCNPDSGVHADGCLHDKNRVAYTLRGLTRATFGEDGGRQRELVRRALEELGHESTEFFWWNAEERRYGREVSHILSFREVGSLPAYAVPRDLPPDAQGVLAWDAFLHESLMRGHYAVLPIELVRELGGADFAVWLAVLLQPATRELASAGEWREYTVSGTKPLIQASRFGLGGQRPDKLRASLERAAERGNAIAERRLGLRLSVEDRSVRGRSPGLKLKLVRTTDRAALRASSSLPPRATSDVYTRTDSVYSGTPPVYTRTGSVYSRTRTERESASLDRLSSRASKTGSTDTRENRSANADGDTSYPLPPWDSEGAVMEAWRSLYPRPPSAPQLRLLGRLVELYDAPGIAAALRAAPPGVDALESVKLRHKAEVRRLAQEDKRKFLRDAALSREDMTDSSVLASIGSRLSSTPPPVLDASPAPSSEDVAAREDEARAMRRAGAVAMLRAGLSGALADRLRAEWTITDEELRD